METSYVACDLGAENGRITLGTLNGGRLNLSEIHQFPNVPARDGDSLEWNIPQLYQHVIYGLNEVGRTDEGVHGVSCSSWGRDYMLFDSGGSLISPTHARPATRTQAKMDKLLSRIPRETIYEETGVQPSAQSTLFQLGVEKSRRLSKADRLLPVADGFNYLLSGQARIEASIASTTQLFNPVQRTWSNRLMETLRLPSHFLPPVVSSGTVLGPLRQDVAKQTKLEDVTVVSSCSDAMASAVVGIPASSDIDWAFLNPGTWSLMGVELPHPILNETARDLDFTNEAGYGNTFRFTKPTVGLWIVEACHRYWAEHEQGSEWDVMIHLASSSTPFESLINPMDPRFQTPEEMPLKIKAFCRESGQNIPRKPGPIIRCVLESIALYYRKTLKEIEDVTGRKIQRLYMLSGGFEDNLLNCFIANALQIPVVIVPREAASMGNLLVQAIGLGHVQSLDEARRIVGESCRVETIQPHAAVWNAAFERLKKLT